MPAKAKLTTRERTTSNVSSDNLNKGSELSFAEADSNFFNLRDQTFAISDGSTSTDIEAGETITFSGATVSGNTVTITGGGASIGDLTVTGSTITAPSNANLRLQTAGGDVEVQDSFIVSNIQASDETQGEMFRVSSTGTQSSTADFNHNGSQTGNFTVYGSDGQSVGANIPLRVEYGAQAEVKINNYTMPSTIGTTNHIMKSNGTNVIFDDIANVIPNTYVQTTDTGLIVVGDDSTGTSFNVGETLKVAGGNGCSTSITGDTLTIDFDQSSIPTQPANTGNFEFSSSTMSGTVTNGDITIQANGTGDIILDTDAVKVGSGSENVVVQSNGTYDLNLSGGSDSKITLTQSDATAGAPAFLYNQQYSIFGTGSSQVKLCSRGSQPMRLMTDSGNGTAYLSVVHNNRVEVTGGDLTVSGNITTNTGVVTGDSIETTGVSINDNKIRSRASNTNLELDAQGTGAVVLQTIKIYMANLPTSDPLSAGQLWNDSGTLKVSAG